MKAAAVAAAVVVGVGVAALTLAIGAPVAHAGDDPRGRVVFGRGTSLWITDPKGKGPAVELAALPGPAADVRAIRSDGDGDTLLIDHGGRWYVAAMPTAGTLATLTELPCGPGPARLTPTGVHVLCGDPARPGKAQIVRLRDGQQFPRDADLAGATVVERGGVRELVFVDQGAVVAASLRDQRQRRVVAPTAPLRGLLAAPDGRRAVGTYQRTMRSPKLGPPRDELMGFALDGTGVPRMLMRNGVAIDWSWNGEWLLVQEGGNACITRGLGGQYKCWKGFTAVSLSPDGAYALVLGPRSGAAKAAAAPPPPTDDDGEGGEDDGELDEVAVPLPKGPLSLYRARLAGAFTDPPALVETVIDGAALWLPEASAASRVLTGDRTSPAAGEADRSTAGVTAPGTPARPPSDAATAATP